MKKLKKYSAFLSLLLLLAFSSTLIPFDLFHTHDLNSRVCNDIKGSCDHKFHVSQKASYCWICAIHFEKTFNKYSPAAEIRTVIGGFIVPDNHLCVNFPRLIFSALRGPPAV